jgi:hypothetical protein
MTKDCVQLERELIEATINYDFGVKRTAGTKIEGAFYSVTFDIKAHADLPALKKTYDDARDAWVEGCVKKP